MLHIYSLSISALGYFLRILTIDGGCCKQSLHFDTGSFSVNIDDPANLRHLYHALAFLKEVNEFIFAQGAEKLPAFKV